MASGGISRKVAIPLRNEAARAQGGLCKYCFDPMSKNSITLDHVEPVGPRLLAGFHPNHGNKFVACCQPCNEAKADTPMPQFVAVIASERLPLGSRKVKEAWERRHRNLRIMDAIRQRAGAAT